MSKTLRVTLFALVSLPSVCLAATAPPMFVLTASAPTSAYIAVVYGDGAVYKKRLPSAFKDRPKRLPENCGPGGVVSLRDLVFYDFEALRQGQPDLVLDPGEVAEQLKRASESDWQYSIETSVSDLTDVGEGCSYAVIGTLSKGYSELRLLGYSDARLSVAPKARLLQDVDAWSRDISLSLADSDRQGSLH